jgi:hypothetical protein
LTHTKGLALVGNTSEWIKRSTAFPQSTTSTEPFEGITGSSAWRCSLLTVCRTTIAIEVIAVIAFLAISRRKKAISTDAMACFLVQLADMMHICMGG